MGDRYTLTKSADLIQSFFNLQSVEGYAPCYNASPTSLLPVITQGSKGLSFFYWGQIPERSKNKSISTKLLVAEAKNLSERAFLKRAMATHRCIIPADGFCIWKQVSKKGKIPYRFVFNDNGLVGFPGLWEEFEDDQGEMAHTFKIITVNANKLVSDMFDRMPAVFLQEKSKQWLSTEAKPEELIPLLQPYSSDKMGSYTISPKISNSQLNEPGLIEPTAPADQFGNYSLFD